MPKNDFNKIYSNFNFKANFDHCTYRIMGDSAHFVKSTTPRVFGVSI